MTTGTAKNALEKTAAFAAGILFACVLLELLLRAGAAMYPAKAPPPGPGKAEFTVLCLGDSFTYGAGAPRGSSYPLQLEAELRRRLPGKSVKVVNLGEMAQNTAQLLALLPGAVETWRPDAAVLLSGGANFWNYKGYRGPGAAARAFFSELKIARLARVLWHSRPAKPQARPPGETGRESPARTACNSLNNDPAKFAEAIAACKEAVAGGDGDPKLLRYISLMLIHSGKAREGVEWAAKAAAADPADMRNFEVASIGCKVLNEPAEAERWLRRGGLRGTGIDPEDLSRELDVPGWISLDLETIVGVLAAARVRTVMMSYPLRNGDNNQDLVRASAILKGTALKLGLPFADNAAAFPPLGESYFADRDVHCSARGYGRIAGLAADLLLPPGPGSRRSAQR